MPQTKTAVCVFYSNSLIHQTLTHRNPLQICLCPVSLSFVSLPRTHNGFDFSSDVATPCQTSTPTILRLSETFSAINGEYAHKQSLFSEDLHILQVGFEPAEMNDNLGPLNSKLLPVKCNAPPNIMLFLFLLETGVNLPSTMERFLLTINAMMGVITLSLEPFFPRTMTWHFPNSCTQSPLRTLFQSERNRSAFWFLSSKRRGGGWGKSKNKLRFRKIDSNAAGHKLKEQILFHVEIKLCSCLLRDDRLILFPKTNVGSGCEWRFWLSRDARLVWSARSITEA